MWGAPPARATSWTGQPVAPDSHWSVSALPAPRAISTSPSGWKRRRPPLGATPTGDESGTPSRLVRRSISRTSTRTFCAIARRSRWRRLRRSVASDSLPPSPKFQASRASRTLAARRISGSVANGRGNSCDWAMAQYYTPVRSAESWYTAAVGAERGSGGGDRLTSPDEPNAPGHGRRAVHGLGRGRTVQHRLVL